MPPHTPLPLSALPTKPASSSAVATLFEATTDPQGDAHYLALKTRDARFDGRFFTGVTSTGIYCRPVCKVRTPKRENCRFFNLAAQAESAGFRPCLRCRPELAPAGLNDEPGAPWSTQDASHILARQAANLLDVSAHSGEFPDASALAERLGVSERHLRRIFAAQWGVSPLQYAQTKRLLAAKQWLTDTQLAVNQIAGLSGFGSLRRFNAAFIAHYRLQPTALRRSVRDSVRGSVHGSVQGSPPTGIRLRAHYRPPYDIGAMLDFLSKRCIAGVEAVDMAQRSYARTLAIRNAQTCLQGWVSARFLDDESAASCAVEILVSESLAPVLPQVLSRVRALLDLDADPNAIDARLSASFPGTEGMRVPGTVDGFELAVRAVLGQQITVAAARTLTARLAALLGTESTTPIAGLTRYFPHVSAFAGTPGIAEKMGEIGIVRQRQQALLTLADAVAQGHIALHPGVDVARTIDALQALPGIGAWTANYIAMRALSWPDAFVAGDVALQKALGVRGVTGVMGASVTPKAAALAAEAASAPWRPWRSYAVIRAWSQLP